MPTLPPPFNTADEEQALTWRLQQQQRFAAIRQRALLLTGNPARWQTLIGAWMPILWRQDPNEQDGDDSE